MYQQAWLMGSYTAWGWQFVCLAGLGTTSTPSPTVPDNSTISRTSRNAQAAQEPRRIGRPWHASCAAGSDPVRGWLLQITQGNNGEALKLFERAALAAPTMVRAYEGIGAAHFGENELPQVPLSRTTVANYRLRMGAKWHKMHHAESRRSLRLRVERRRFPRADSGRQPVAQLATYTWQIRYDMQHTTLAGSGDTRVPHGGAACAALTCGAPQLGGVPRQGRGSRGGLKRIH